MGIETVLYFVCMISINSANTVVFMGIETVLILFFCFHGHRNSANTVVFMGIETVLIRLFSWA